MESFEHDEPRVWMTESTARLLAPHITTTIPIAIPRITNDITWMKDDITWMTESEYSSAIHSQRQGRTDYHEPSRSLRTSRSRSPSRYLRYFTPVVLQSHAQPRCRHGAVIPLTPPSVDIDYPTYSPVPSREQGLSWRREDDPNGPRCSHGGLIPSRLMEDDMPSYSPTPHPRYNPAVAPAPHPRYNPALLSIPCSSSLLPQPAAAAATCHTWEAVQEPSHIPDIKEAMESTSSRRTPKPRIPEESAHEKKPVDPAGQTLMLNRMWHKIFTRATWQDLCSNKTRSYIQIKRMAGPITGWLEVRDEKKILDAFPIKRNYLNLEQVIHNRVCDEDSMQMMVWILFKIANTIFTGRYTKSQALKTSTFQQKKLTKEDAKTFLWTEAEFILELKNLLVRFAENTRYEMPNYLLAIARYIFCLVEFFYFANGVCPQIRGLIGGNMCKLDS
jgi:hypothetical protein